MRKANKNKAIIGAMKISMNTAEGDPDKYAVADILAHVTRDEITATA